MTCRSRKKGRAAISIEGEIRTIEPAISGRGDCREAMLSIYRVAWLMLRDRDPSLPQSVTHRELYRIISCKQPSLSSSLGTITGYYEDAAFGHFPVTRRRGRQLAAQPERDHGTAVRRRRYRLMRKAMLLLSAVFVIALLLVAGKFLVSGRKLRHDQPVLGRHLVRRHGQTGPCPCTASVSSGRPARATRC